MQFLKNKTVGLLILFCGTLPLLGMNTSRILQKEKIAAQVKSRKQQQQQRKTFEYPQLKTVPSQEFKPVQYQESMYDVDAPKFKPVVEITKSTFFSKLSDWWYGTAKYIPIGATEPRAPKVITITSKQLDGDSIAMVNTIISLVANDNNQEVTKRIVAVIKRKLQNNLVYSDNFCQTLSTLITRKLYIDPEKYQTMDEVMNITHASREFRKLILLININKIPIHGFNLLKQLVREKTRKLKQNKEEEKTQRE